MNFMIYVIECIGMIILFTCLIIIPLCQNPIWWIHDYPTDIQEKYFETHERIPTAITSGTVLLKKGAALVFTLAVFVCLALLAGAESFMSAFLCSYGLWSLINWYDCFFLDWVLFANMKSVRLPGTEHMDRAYHQKLYHFKRAIIGAVLGLLPSLLTGLIVGLIR